MTKIIDMIKEINKNSEEISNVQSFHEDLITKYKFRFRTSDFTIWSYYSEAYENIVWLLNMHAKKGDIIFSTADYDLDGYQNHFASLQRNVEMKLKGFDDELESLLKKKK